MRTNLKRVALSIAALTAASAGLVLSSTSASALPAGTPPVAPATLSPSSGGINANYTLTPPANSFCPGDSAAGGYSVRTFMTQQDPATLTYAGAGPIGAGFTQPLFSSTGSPIIAVNTAPAAPGSVQGRILSLGQLSFSALLTVPDGAYTIGLACVKAGITETFYSTQVTFTADSWSFGARPGAPVLTTSSYNAGTTTATVNFTHATSVPATTGYTATVVGSPAIGPIAVPAGATSFQIPGVALGASYTVSLVATNGTGTSVASNTVTVVGAATTAAPVVTVLDVFDGDDVVVTWTAPAGPVAPASYDVVIRDGASATVASQLAVAGLTATFTAIPQGSGYIASVTPNYPAGSGVLGQTGTDGFAVNPGALIVQELTVTRPAGALILTQRCGVNNALPAIPVIPGFPGNPRQVPAQGATLDQTGTSPDTDLVATGVQVDPEFGNYPLPNPPSGPAIYPTECGLDMGTAQFVTTGDLAGQFFHAYGALNEVTVLDTRDGDAGWTVRGDIEDRFTSAANGDSFSGDYLGWQPVMSGDSGEVGGEGPNGVGPLYNQTVTAGNGIPAGTGFSTAGIGLTDNPVLASAPASSGLGIATLDAVVFLLIPTSVDAADYSGTLTLTVA